MIPGLVASLLLTAAALPDGPPSPVCGSDAGEPYRRWLVAELNAARRAAGLELLEPHPVLCEVARDQAAAVAATGGTPGEAGHIEGTTRRLYRSGYRPHAWTEGSLIATSDAEVLDQWRRVRPQWYAEMEAGDFEHVGVGLGRHRGRLVVTLVLALETRTMEWRHAATLEDLGRVREIALATVNEIRRRHGREPLAGEPLLDAAAQRHAEDLQRREYYAHASPEGEEVRDRARAVGYRARTLGENLAKGPFTPDEVVRRWMDSSGHRRNILKRGWTKMGFGVACGVNSADEFEFVWVQVFSSP